MAACTVLALLLLTPLVQAPVVRKLNGPLAGDVSGFTWTPDARYVVYGAERNDPDVDVVTCLRLSDGSEVVYDLYPFFLGSAHVSEFAFPPDPEHVGVRYATFDGSVFPPATARPMYVIERSSVLPPAVAGDSPRFLDDGRLLYRTSVTVYRGSTYERAWSSRWDSVSAAIELSPPQQPDNHVSLVLPALRAGVAVFGWRDTISSTNDAELLAVPIDGGTPVPLTPQSPSLRSWVDVLHVRASDELVVYLADEVPGVMEQWAVPVDGSLAPRRLNPPLPPGRDLFDSLVAPDEKRILFLSDLQTDRVYELWSTDLDSGASVRLSGPMVPGGSIGFDEFWIGPDSARVVYRADQRIDGVFELFIAPLDGQAPAELLHAPLPAGYEAMETVHFTPDGRLVVFAVRVPRGVVLASARADGRGDPRVLNWPFVRGGGVAVESTGILSTVALAADGEEVFFLGQQDTAGVVELYSVPIDGSAPPRKWNAPLVAGGDVSAFAPRPFPGAVLYRADQDLDGKLELYLSKDLRAGVPHAPSVPPTRTVARTVDGG